MKVRDIRPGDIDVWSRLRTQLWADTADAHRQEIQAYFDRQSIDIEHVYVVEVDGGTVVGFIEINIRNFAEGSRQPAVPYIEGWYIEDGYRSRGLGKQLMLAAEGWARSRGYCEIASDTEWHNENSIEVHKHLGFREQERVVCFLKKLE